MVWIINLFVLFFIHVILIWRLNLILTHLLIRLDGVSPSNIGILS